MEEMSKEVPEGVEHVFISAVTGFGISTLKDMLWRAITDESNKIESSMITHRRLDGHHRVREEDEFIFENEPEELPSEDELEEGDWEENWDDEAWEYGDPEQ